MYLDFLYNLQSEFQYIAHLKFFRDLIWVMQNFLTMECYRKICNQFYWKKLEPGTASYKRRIWMIALTSLSAVFLAFYYNPTDPTNSNSSAGIVKRISSYIKSISVSINLISSKLVSSAHSLKHYFIPGLLESENVFLWHSKETYLKTSALLI